MFFLANEYFGSEVNFVDKDNSVILPPKRLSQISFSRPLKNAYFKALEETGVTPNASGTISLDQFSKAHQQAMTNPDFQTLYKSEQLGKRIKIQVAEEQLLREQSRLKDAPASDQKRQDIVRIARGWEAPMQEDGSPRSKVKDVGTLVLRDIKSSLTFDSVMFETPSSKENYPGETFLKDLPDKKNGSSAIPLDQSIKLGAKSFVNNSKDLLKTLSEWFHQKDKNGLSGKADFLQKLLFVNPSLIKDILEQDPQMGYLVCLLLKRESSKYKLGLEKAQKWDKFEKKWRSTIMLGSIAASVFFSFSKGIKIAGSVAKGLSKVKPLKKVAAQLSWMGKLPKGLGLQNVGYRGFGKLIPAAIAGFHGHSYLKNRSASQHLEDQGEDFIQFYVAQGIGSPEEARELLKEGFRQYREAWADGTVGLAQAAFVVPALTRFIKKGAALPAMAKAKSKQLAELKKVKLEFVKEKKLLKGVFLTSKKSRDIKIDRIRLIRESQIKKIDKTIGKAQTQIRNINKKLKRKKRLSKLATSELKKKREGYERLIRLNQSKIEHLKAKPVQPLPGQSGPLRRIYRKTNNLADRAGISRSVSRPLMLAVAFQNDTEIFNAIIKTGTYLKDRSKDVLTKFRRQKNKTTAQDIVEQYQDDFRLKDIPTEAAVELEDAVMEEFILKHGEENLQIQKHELEELPDPKGKIPFRLKWTISSSDKTVSSKKIQSLTALLEKEISQIPLESYRSKIIELRNNKNQVLNEILLYDNINSDPLVQDPTQEVYGYKELVSYLQNEISEINQNTRDDLKELSAQQREAQLSYLKQQLKDIKTQRIEHFVHEPNSTITPLFDNLSYFIREDLPIENTYKAIRGELKNTPSSLWSAQTLEKISGDIGEALEDKTFDKISDQYAKDEVDQEMRSVLVQKLDLLAQKDYESIYGKNKKINLPEEINPPLSFTLIPALSESLDFHLDDPKSLYEKNDQGIISRKKAQTVDEALKLVDLKVMYEIIKPRFVPPSLICGVKRPSSLLNTLQTKKFISSTDQEKLHQKIF